MKKIFILLIVFIIMFSIVVSNTNATASSRITTLLPETEELFHLAELHELDILWQKRLQSVSEYSIRYPDEFMSPINEFTDEFRVQQMVIKGESEGQEKPQPHSERSLPTQATPQYFVCSTIEDVPPIECEALVAFYNSTNGADWTDNSNWLITKTVGNWYGVTVTTGKVTNISLQLNGLNGSISPQLSNLSSLKYLFLGGNQLSGSIPPELGSLSSLVDFHAWGNQLTGTLPAELGSLGNLEWLILSENHISGRIPTQFGNLSSLTTLGLNDNQLTGSIPPEFGNFSNMQLLDLSNNLLNGTIPPGLGNLSNLWALILRNNQLIGSIPLSFVNLINLDGFSYENTGLCEPNDASFQAWKSTVSSWSGTGFRCELSVFLPISLR